jgi:hypothetical protein
MGQFFEAVEPATKMKKIPNSSRRLREHILRALNKIRKPSTAGEITELLNRDLDLEDRPFQEKDVEEWLRKHRGHSIDAVLVKSSSSKIRIIPLAPLGYAHARRMQQAPGPQALAGPEPACLPLD